MTVVRVLYIALVALGFIPAATFMIMYLLTSSSRSRRSEVGIILVALPAIVAALLGLSLVSFLVRVWPPLWLAGMLGLDVVLWWLLWLLWRLRRRQRQVM